MVDEKSPVIEQTLEVLSDRLAMPRSVAFKEMSCVTCGGKAKSFKDDLSRKEYSLSGMCQHCQDDFFT